MSKLKEKIDNLRFLLSKSKVLDGIGIKKTADFKPKDKIFVSGDGDGIGSLVEQKVLANDLEGLIQQSKAIERGQEHIKMSFENLGGKMLVHGGDDNLALIDSKYMDEIEKIRQGYSKATGGFTITFGVGTTMREAVKALVYGKLTGKNKLVFWHDGLNKELEQLAKPQTQEEKMKEHGMLSEDIAKARKMKMDLKKMPLVFDSKKHGKPYTTVYRMENKEGIGPYHHPSMTSAEWAESAKLKERQPAPFEDEGFSSAEKAPGKYSEGVKFGFEKPEHATKWFTPAERERLSAKGFAIKQVKAKKVWAGKHQVYFEPYEEK